MRTGRAIALGLGVVGLSACDRKLDLVIDATAYANATSATTLEVELVLGGEARAQGTIDLRTDPTLRIEDVVLLGTTNGVVAFADVDGDGACALDVDDGWVFVYDPAPGEDLSWTVDADTFRDLRACEWFSGNALPFDTGGPGDTR